MPESSRPLALRLLPLDGTEPIGFVEVEGDLRTGGDRWTELLRQIVEDGVTGLAVDLRGCAGIDHHSLNALLAASATLVVKGGNGAAIITLPGSELQRRIQDLAGHALAVHHGANDAIRALRVRRR